MPPAPLTSDELEELERLEQRVGEHDGVRLKLEWPSLRDGRTAALTHRVDGELAGFLGVYAFGGPPDVELTGMVDPAHRRHGIATALWEQASDACANQGFTRRLAVVPRRSAAGAALVLARGGVLEHSEHSMLQRGEPEWTPEDPEVSLRPALDADRPDLIRTLTAGFGPPPEAMLAQLETEHDQTHVIERAGEVVGTLRLSLQGRLGGVYAFTVDPEWRGRGIGRDVLVRACAELRRRGADEVELQVEVDNDAALRLYTSTGFASVSIDDYYRLPAEG